MVKNLNSRLFSDKEYFKKLLFISLPIILQNLISSSVNMIDTFMVGRLGDIEVASVGIGNQVYSLIYFVTLGIAGGCSVFISQYWGKKDKLNIRRVTGFLLMFSGIVALVFTIVVQFFTSGIVGIFNKELSILEQGSSYLKIVSLSYLFNALTLSVAAASRSVEKSTLPMIASLIALITNAVFNYIFIFGKLGLEPMGVEGAAWGTLIARTVEFLVLYIYSFKTNKVLWGKLSDLIDISKSFIKKIYGVVIDVVLNEITWGLGVVIYSVIYGKIGSSALASVQIYTTVTNFFFVAVLGIAAGSLVIVGKEIGGSNLEKAKGYGYNSFTLSIYIGVILSIALAFTAPFIVSLFNVSEEVRQSTKIILYITSAMFTMRCVNIVLIIGVLRGGGDAKFAFRLEAITVWLIGVPVAFIGAIILKLPISVVVGLVMIEEVIKSIFGAKRLFSDKWIRVLT